MRALIILATLLGCGRSHELVPDAAPDAWIDPDADLDIVIPVDPFEIPEPACTDACNSVLVGLEGEEGRILELVAEHERLDYDAWVGRYTCGDEPRAVYAGEMNARDDRGDFETAYESGLIDGLVVATLDVQWPPPWNGHARLTMHSPNGRQLRIEHAPESPEWAESSAVEPSDHTVPAHSAGCRGCMPFMADFPDVIEIEPFEMDAIVGSWRVWGEGGRVTRVAPPDVTLTQLEILAGPYGDFDEYDRSPDAWRRVRTGAIEEPIDDVPDDFDACFLVTDYELGEAIGAACPGSHLLGPLRILQQQRCCVREVFIEDCMCDVPFRTERECFGPP